MVPKVLRALHGPGEAVQNENGRPLPRSRQTAAHRGTATTRFPEQLQGCTHSGKSTARPPKQGKRQSLVATRIELPRWCVAGRLPTEKAVGHPGGPSLAGTVARGARPRMRWAERKRSPGVLHAKGGRRKGGPPTGPPHPNARRRRQRAKAGRKTNCSRQGALNRGAGHGKSKRLPLLRPRHEARVEPGLDQE